MVKLRKNNLKALLCFLIFLSYIVHGYSATVTVDKDNIRYTVDLVTNEAQVYGPVSSSTTLTNLEIPDFIEYNSTKISVTSIRHDAFYGCSGLTSVTIPNSVTEIGNYAFNGCKSLDSLTFEDGETPIKLGYNNYSTSDGKGLFADCLLRELYLGRDIQYIDYSSLFPWNSYPVRYGYSAFYNQRRLLSVTIGNLVKNLSEYLFYGCNGLTSVTIPYSVTEIGSSAFENCSSLTNVTIPNSVTEIGNYAFYGCSGLTSVTIGNSVTSIGGRAFQNINTLEEVRLLSDNYIPTLGDNAFKFDGKTKLIVLNKEITLDVCHDNNWNKFSNIYYSDDKNLYVPVIWNGGITTEGALFINDLGCLVALNQAIKLNAKEDLLLAFYKGLNVINELRSDDGLTITAENIWYNNYITTVVNNETSLAKEVNLTSGGTLFNEVGLQDIEKIETLVITGDLNGTDIMTINRMTSLKYLDISDANIVEGGQTYRENLKTQDNIIGSYFFSDCKNLTIVILPNSALTINSKIFNEISNVETIVIGKNTEKIYNEAFSGCSKLSSITIPNSVTSIGNMAFYGCSGLKEVRIEDGETTLSLGYNSYIKSGTGSGLFGECPLKKIYIGRNLSYDCDKEYGYSPFANKSTLTSVSFGSQLTAIPPYVLYGCSGLTSVEIPNSVTSIGNSAFSYCSGLTGDLVIPNSVTSIGSWAFSYCSGLTGDLVIPNSVTSIGSWAFSYCSGLTGDLVIPNSVTSIGEWAFYGCSSLSGVIISDLSAWCRISFWNEYANPLYYAKYLYLNDELLTDIVIPSSITSINKYAFYNGIDISSITIPNSVTSIGVSAFSGCSGLKEVTIEDGENALSFRFNSTSSTVWFGDCPLEKVYIGRNLDYMSGFYYGYSPFANITKLTTVVIGPNVTSLGGYLFYRCSSITDITIPNSVTSIGANAFEYCSSLKEITIPNSVTSIGSSAFDGCSSLEELTLGVKLISIGDNGFANCSNLTKIRSLNPIPPKISSSVFSKVDKESCQLVVTKGNLVYYWLDPVWKEFLNISDDLVYLSPLPEVTYGVEPVDLSLYAPEGVTFTYETSNPDIALIDGTILSIVGTGTATVGALYDQSGTPMEIIGQMRQFIVDKADLSVSVNSIEIYEGEQLPELKISFEGLCYDDTIEDIEELPVATCEVTSESAPGEYPVVFAGGQSRNYNFVFADSKVIIKERRKISILPIENAVYGDEPIDLTQFTPEGESVVYSLEDDDAAEIADNVLTIKNAGTFTIYASLSEETTDAMIVNPELTFTIEKAPLEISVRQTVWVPGTPFPEFEYVATGLKYDDTLDDIEELPAIFCDADENSPLGEYEIRLEGGADRNYNIMTVSSKLIITDEDTTSIESVVNSDRIHVFNYNGILIYEGLEEDLNMSELEKGVYIFVKGNTSRKVLIK